MKEKRFSALSGILLLVVVVLGIYSLFMDVNPRKNNKEENNSTFRGIIKEVNSTEAITVKPLNSEEIAKSSNEIYVVMEDNEVEYKEDQIVTISYDGMVRETFPVTIEAIDIKVEEDLEQDCELTRTYNILAVYDDDDYDYQDVSINAFMMVLVNTIRVKRELLTDVVTGITSSYEFVFKGNSEVLDTVNEENFSIEETLKHSTLVSVKKTDKEGMEQIQEYSCSK